MVVLKTLEEIDQLYAANQIVVEVLLRLQEVLTAGVTTIELDRIAEEHIRDSGAVPAFLGYMDYKYTLCTSVNDEVVHGLPDNTPLKEEDILSIDCGVLLNAFTVGESPTEDVARFLRVSEESLNLGIEQMRPGKRLFDISSAIQRHVEGNGYTVVRDYVGHGIGRNLHEEPQVPNFGVEGTGMKLMPGLVLAIEPMVNMGSAEVRLEDDGWTVSTMDASLSAHFEHSVALLDDGPKILSRIN